MHFSADARNASFYMILRPFAGVSVQKSCIRLAGAIWGAWVAAGISHILRNGLYAGVAQWAGVEVELSEHPAIITKETYDQAQELIKSQGRGARVDLK
jgi:hypothetical protein